MDMTLSDGTRKGLQARLQALRLKYGPGKSGAISAQAIAIVNGFMQVAAGVPDDLKFESVKLALDNLIDAREEIETGLARLIKQDGAL